MSQNLEEGPLKEAAIFTRAVENVFRKLIRLLLGRMTLVKLQEMIRVVYIDEAEQKLKSEQPDKKASLTKLALLTGLDTRTLNKVIGEKIDTGPFHTEDRFLKDITPESSVLDYWSTSEKYRDPVSKKPLILSLRGKVPSFDSLIKDIGVPRGITVGSILERLERSDSIRLDEGSQTVTLLRSRFLPFSKKGESEALEVGFVTVGYLVDTLIHNLEKKESKGAAFFQRSNWTTRLDRSQLETFRREMRSNLSTVESGLNGAMSKFEEPEMSNNQITAGFSMFYFEEASTKRID